MKELHWETEHDTANRTMTQTLGEIKIVVDWRNETIAGYHKDGLVYTIGMADVTLADYEQLLIELEKRWKKAPRSGN